MHPQVSLRCLSLLWSKRKSYLVGMDGKGEDKEPRTHPSQPALGKTTSFLSTKLAKPVMERLQGFQYSALCDSISLGPENCTEPGDRCSLWRAQERAQGSTTPGFPQSMKPCAFTLCLTILPWIPELPTRQHGGKTKTLPDPPTARPSGPGRLAVGEPGLRQFLLC